MNSSVWTTTLEQFRGRLSGRDPAPAGVAAAAVSATLALGLLIKVLDITRNRKTFEGDPHRFEELMHSARNESQRLAYHADQDIVAFYEYLASRRLTEGREQAMAAALRKAIEVPLGAARAAANGLQLCAQSADLIPSPLKPDLAAAEALLKGAIRAILFSVDSNLQQETDPQFRAKFEAQRRDLE